MSAKDIPLQLKPKHALAFILKELGEYDSELQAFVLRLTDGTRIATRPSEGWVMLYRPSVM